MGKSKNKNKITNSNSKGGNNQNVVVEIHIGEEIKELKGKIKDEEKEELLKRLDEVEQAYNQLQEDKEIVEKSVRIDVPVSIPSFPNTSNDKGEILQGIMDMKNKIQSSKEKLQDFISSNQGDMDLQFRELLYGRGYKIDLTEEEKRELNRQSLQQNQQQQQPILTAPQRSTDGLPPPNQVLPQSQQEVASRGRPAQNIPDDIFSNSQKYLDDGTIPKSFSDGRGGVIFNNSNQLKGGVRMVNQGNSPDIVRKAYDKLRLSQAPSTIQQKDLQEELMKIKRNDERVGGLTDFRGNLVYTEEDNRTPKQQQAEKRMTKKEIEKSVDTLNNIRLMEDKITKLEMEKSVALNKIGIEDTILKGIKERNGGIEEIQRAENVRGIARENYQNIENQIQQLKIKIADLNVKQKKLQDKQEKTQLVKFDRFNRDDGGYSSGGMRF
jgi:hypothetical protein